jgi:hypothetical protein
MEDTRCGENCCFVKSGFCDSDTGCPNYTETLWEESSSGKLKTVKDCSPKRTMIEQQRMINSFSATQGSVQVLRDKVDNLETLLVNLVNQTKQVFIELQEKSEVKKIQQRNPDE